MPSLSVWGERDTKFFYELTPERILEAVEHSTGVRCTGRVLALNSLENRVYEVEIDLDEPPRNPSERFLITKFYRPGRWTKEQILEEHTYLKELAELEIPVICPLNFQDGQTLHKLTQADIWYTVFPKQGGRSPDELTDSQLAQVGRLLGRMHNVGATKPALHRLKISPATYGTANLEHLVRQKLIPADIEASYSKIVETICQLATPLFERTANHRIHGDCHLGNLLLGRDGLFFVDFDDMVTGPAVQDMWILIPGRDEEARRQLKILIEGYETMRTFDRRSLVLIEALRALRIIHFSAWIGRRWQDPAFPRAFPSYGTPKYWQSQLLDLREGLSLLQDPQPFWF